MSTANQSCSWRVVKDQKVVDKLKKNVVKIQFLRHGMIDDYNNGMNHGDHSDQLRGTYRFDHWMKQGNKCICRMWAEFNGNVRIH
jgi:hypothetical protein